MSQTASVPDSGTLSGISGIGGDGLIVNTVSTGPAIDANHDVIGEVLLGGVSKFTSIRPDDPIAVPAALQGQDYTLSLDYFIPDNTSLDNNDAGDSPDLFWIQVDVGQGGEALQNINVNAGFIGGAAAGGGWQTLSLTNTFPEDATSVLPLFVLADGGFGSGEPNGGATPAVFIDNVSFTVDAVVQSRLVSRCWRSLGSQFSDCVENASFQLAKHATRKRHTLCVWRFFFSLLAQIVVEQRRPWMRVAIYRSGGSK